MMEFSVRKSKIMEDLDLKFLKFYHQVIEDDIKLQSSSKSKDSLKRVKDWFRKENIDSNVLDIDFDSSAMRCAYIYHYGPCFTSIVACHFLKLLEASNSFLFQRISLRETFTICCLGGGPATEVVAIVEVLEKEVIRCCPRRVKSLVIDVVIVDVEPAWATTAGKVVKMVDASVVQLNFSFLQADLTKPLTDDVKNALRKSDIVTMVNILSAVSRYSDTDTSLHMIQEIIQSIGKDGVLFFLDCHEYKHCNFLMDMVNSSESMKQIYGPHHNHIYRMSVLCMKECLRLYSKFYGWRYCALEAISCACAWYKM